MTATGFQIVAFALSSFIAVVGALGMTTTMSMFRSGIFLMASFLGVGGLFILLSADLLGLLQIMMYIGGILVMILFMVLFMHDPGGAMMASMPGMMAPIERWFSKGLTPQVSARDEPVHGQHAAGRLQSRPSAKSQPPAHEHRHGGGGHPASGAGAGEDDGGRAEHAGHGGADQGMDHGGMDMSMVTPVRRAVAWLAGGLTLLLVGLLLFRPAWPMVRALPDPDSPRRIGELLMGKYMIAFEGAGTLILIGIFGAVLLARPSAFPDDPARSARVAVAENPPALADEGLEPRAEVATHHPPPAAQAQSDAEHQGEHRG